MELRAGPSDECLVEVWDVEKGTRNRTWGMDAAKQEQLKRMGDGFAFVDVALSPSGKQMAWLLSPKEDGKEKRCAIFLHDTATGKLLRELKEVTERPQKIHLLDEGQTLLLQTYSSFGNTGNVVISVASARQHFRFDYRLAYFIHRSREKLYIQVLGVSADWKSLFTHDEVGMIQWDLVAGKKLGEWSEDCTALAFFANGKQAVIARGARWHLCDAQLKPRHPSIEFSEPPFVRFLPDGRLIVQAWSRRLNVWDVKQEKIVESLWRHKAPAVGRSPCDYDFWGKLFVYHVEKGLAIRDLVRDRQVCLLEGVKVENAWDAFPLLSADGKRVLVSVKEKNGYLIRWFESSSGRELGRYCIPKKEFLSDRFRPVQWFSTKGTVFGYVTLDNQLALVDCEQRKVCQVLGIALPKSRENAKQQNAVPEWSYENAGDDHFLLASRKQDAFPGRKEYVLWNRATGQMIRHFYLQPEGLPEHWWNSLISPEGRFLAVLAGAKVLLYETATGRCRGEIQAPNAIHSVSFSPDGKTLATSCADTSVLIWDINRPLSSKAAMPPPKNAVEAKPLWQSLGDPDPRMAEPALWALVRTPQLALPLLKQHLQPMHRPRKCQF